MVWYWQKNIQVDQWNRIESPEIDPPHTNTSQLIFDEGAESFQQMTRNNWTST